MLRQEESAPLLRECAWRMRRARDRRASPPTIRVVSSWRLYHRLAQCSCKEAGRQPESFSRVSGQMAEAEEEGWSADRLPSGGKIEEAYPTLGIA